MWPWDWVSAAGNAISGLTQKAVDWVNSLIASVMAWVTTAINSIWSAITGIWRDIQNVWNQLVTFVNTLGSQLWRAIYSLGDSIRNWAVGIFNDVWNYIKGVYDWAARAVDNLYHLVTGWVSDIYRWVQREVWDPLYRLYQDVKNWVVQQFNRVWQYIEHPELLAQLLGGYLLRVWFLLVKQFAVPLVRWLIRAMHGMVGEVFDLLETVISNIF